MSDSTTSPVEDQSEKVMESSSEAAGMAKQFLGTKKE
jgi:hypothetical protein